MERGNLRGEVSLCGINVLYFHNLTGKEKMRQVVRIALQDFLESKESANLHCSAQIAKRRDKAVAIEKK
ncbi:MAG TPA: hypothetical protein VKB04_03555 [Anaerolineales bacterium]|nr:hypothetical protein [Anaerolineales bacterium]